MSQKRAAALVVNPSRSEAVEAAGVLADLLLKADFDLFTISDVEISGVTNTAAENLPELEIAFKMKK
jgi:NAD+ kinase